MRELISKKQASAIVGQHPEHIMRLARSGRFPRPVRLGASRNGAVRFVVDEVEEWLNAKLAERDAPKPVLVVGGIEEEGLSPNDSLAGEEHAEEHGLCDRVFEG